MKPTPPTSVDGYIAAQPEPVQPVLKRVRTAIRKALPNARESISYNIPTYKLNGKPVLYFAAWKTFLSVYPITRRVVDAFPSELAPHLHSKGTARFPFSEPIPIKLIAAIAKCRAGEVA